MTLRASGCDLNWLKAYSSHSQVRHSLAQFQVPVRLYHILPTFSYSNRTLYKRDFLTSKDPSIFNCFIFNKASALPGYDRIKIKENIPKGENTMIWHHKCDLHAFGLFFSCQYALYLEKTPPNYNTMINLGSIGKER